MIVSDPHRALPEAWTEAAMLELVEHAHDLAMHGNPAGFFLVNDVKDLPDMDSLRARVEANPALVRTAWQYRVVGDR